ncbi:MAG: hypothetical protein AB9888_13700 [Bacteroidales bacterium]
MKRSGFIIVLLLVSLIQYGQIVADHTVVDKYDDIPQYCIDQVKKMWLPMLESHIRTAAGKDLENGFCLRIGILFIQ